MNALLVSAQRFFKEQPSAALTTSAVCVVGALFIFYHLHSSRKSKTVEKQQDRKLGVGNKRVLGLSMTKDLNGPSAVEHTDQLALPRETESDFIRTITANTDDVYFSAPLLGRLGKAPVEGHGTDVRVPYMCMSSKQDHAAVLKEFKDKFFATFESVFGDRIKVVHSGHAQDSAEVNAFQLLDTVIRWITISPAFAVMMATDTTPSLYQPTFLVAFGFGANNTPDVRVVVNAFVGSPPKGPPNPSEKYTDHRLCFLSENLVEYVTSSRFQDSDDVQVSFVIQRTTATRMAQVLQARDELLSRALQQAGWDEYLDS